MRTWILVVGLFLTTQTGIAAQIGKFDTQRDLLIAQFDLKTDVDDVHSVAAVATMLADARLAKVRCHAVAGAYGKQEGLYVPANELFEACFPGHWSDAHVDRDRAVAELLHLVLDTFKRGGVVWVAEGGQSDLSADVIRKVRQRDPAIDTQKRFHIVQHADWNESETRPENLSYVKKYAEYHRIASGNETGNGTPGFRTANPVDWRRHMTRPDQIKQWKLALAIANKYNGHQGRYNNVAIANGGLDFSDTIEACWILGFGDLSDADHFFAEFSQDGK